jgi:hypothetical protein
MTRWFATKSLGPKNHVRWVTNTWTPEEKRNIITNVKTRGYQYAYREEWWNWRTRAYDTEAKARAAAANIDGYVFGISQRTIHKAIKQIVRNQEEEDMGIGRYRYITTKSTETDGMQYILSHYDTLDRTLLAQAINVLTLPAVTNQQWGDMWVERGFADEAEAIRHASIKRFNVVRVTKDDLYRALTTIAKEARA